MPKYQITVATQLTRYTNYLVEAASEELAEDMLDSDLLEPTGEYEKVYDGDTFITEVKE